MADSKVNSSEIDSGEVNRVDTLMDDQEVETKLEGSISEISLESDNIGSTGRPGLINESRTYESGTSKESPNIALPEIIKPCGRINACMAVGRDTLYLYGGMMEVKDREITLDDLYTLNLSKLDEWKCIIPTSESEWIEASEDEDEDEDEEDDEEEDDSEDGESSAEESDDEEMEAVNADGKSLQVGEAVALIKGKGKSLRRKEKRARIEQIRASLGLSDSMRTPMPGESLKDFYKRTNMYWQMAAYEHTQHTGKELRKDGFDFAEARYRELKPLLDELVVLEEEQKAEEQEVAESSAKRGNKKNARPSSKR